jgi:hypothetical protein
LKVFVFPCKDSCFPFSCLSQVGLLAGIFSWCSCYLFFPLKSVGLLKYRSLRMRRNVVFASSRIL